MDQINELAAGLLLLGLLLLVDALLCFVRINSLAKRLNRLEGKFYELDERCEKGRTMGDLL